MQRIPGMVIPITPKNAFTLEEISLLSVCRMSPTYIFEFVLAMWPSMKSLMDLREDFLYEHLAVELGDALVAEWSEVEIETEFPLRYDALYALMKRLFERLIPYFATIPDGLPDQPVQTVTYQPFCDSASLLRFHVEDLL